jgi:hypothetical protein
MMVAFMAKRLPVANRYSTWLQIFVQPQAIISMD